MKPYINNLIFKTLFSIGLPQLLQKKIAYKSFTIVTYHAVVDTLLPVHDWCFIDKNSFEEQMHYLKNNFDILPLKEANILGNKAKHEKPIAFVTFDDGYQNNYDIAFPILNEIGIPATIFLNTKFVDTDDTIWFCKINHAIEKTKKHFFEWKGNHFKIDSMRDKVLASAILQEKLKKLPNKQLQQEVQNIRFLLEDSLDNPISVDSPYRILGSHAINKMTKSNLIEFGAHTHSHAILSQLSKQEKEKEIQDSVSHVEHLTNCPCRFFAYPNGSCSDYDDESINIIKLCGVNSAVTMIPGPNFTSTPLMQLRRYGIGGNTNITNFKVIVHHLKWLLKF